MDEHDRPEFVPTQAANPSGKAGPVPFNQKLPDGEWRRYYVGDWMWGVIPDEYVWVQLRPDGVYWLDEGAA